MKLQFRFKMEKQTIREALADVGYICAADDDTERDNRHTLSDRAGNVVGRFTVYEAVERFLMYPATNR